jgi:hypothetical protein
MPKEEIEKIRAILSEKLDAENGQVTRKQMAECEAWLSYISPIYRKKQRILAQKTLQALPPKEKGITELDRQVTLEALVAPLQQEVDELKDIIQHIQLRITTGQSFLKSMQAEIERGL